MKRSVTVWIGVMIFLVWCGPARGLDLGLGLTGVLQGTRGDTSATDGSYSADIEATAEVGYGTAYVHLEGGDGDGATDEVPGVNADALGPVGSKFDIVEAWWEFSLKEGLVVTLGKLDPTVYFDANGVANDECTQFLADMFVNNVAMAWPDYSPGVRVSFALTERWELSLGAFSMDADWEDLDQGVFTVGELAFKPLLPGLEGTYRFYLWRDGTGEGNWGLGLSFDQQVTPEATLFGRFGYPNEAVDGVEFSWSLGGQMAGSRWGKEDDVVGLALGQALLKNADKDEARLEAYYSLSLGEKITLSPDLQVVLNPQGKDKKVVVLGLRTQIGF